MIDEVVDQRSHEVISEPNYPIAVKFGGDYVWRKWMEKDFGE